MKKCLKILSEAKQVLLSDSPPKDFPEFFQMLSVTPEDYYEALSVSHFGKVVVLKRNFQELYINNYNVAWLEAWDANIDLQLCCDTYAVITYICDYYSKDETGMTDLLKETIRTHDTKQGNATLLQQMKNVYSSHRQVSACEATYRLLPQLHLKESNITTVFV